MEARDRTRWVPSKRLDAKRATGLTEQMQGDAQTLEALNHVDLGESIPAFWVCLIRDAFWLVVKETVLFLIVGGGGGYVKDKSNLSGILFKRFLYFRLTEYVDQDQTCNHWLGQKLRKLRELLTWPR